MFSWLYNPILFCLFPWSYSLFLYAPHRINGIHNVVHTSGLLLLPFSLLSSCCYQFFLSWPSPGFNRPVITQIYYVSIWSKMKRIILFGLLNGLHFTVQIIMMDSCSQVGFSKLLFQSSGHSVIFFNSLWRKKSLRRESELWWNVMENIRYYWKRNFYCVHGSVVNSVFNSLYFHS